MFLAVNVSLRRTVIWSVRCAPLDTWVCLEPNIFRVRRALEMCINGRGEKERPEDTSSLPSSPPERTKKLADGH